MPVVHPRWFWFLLAVVPAAIAGCDDDSPSSTSRALRCDPAAVPVLLASKADDEDGDGHVLDEEFPTIDDEDDDIADHTWVRDAMGRHHLFFHDEGRGMPWKIEHYVTRSLDHLEYAGTALVAQAGAWDAGDAWAPHVIEIAGTYYMFYTGVDGIGPGATQRIGLATSNDLVHWKRAPVNRCPGTSGDGCLYECNEAWTVWADGASPDNRQCRDAFVLRDDANDRWLMFVTARSTNGYGVVTVAYSDDLVTWSGAGYINATRRLSNGVDAQTTGGQCENPFVIPREDAYCLLFTDWKDPEDSLDVATPRTIVQYATSASLEVDMNGSPQWAYRGYTPDPGVNAIEVFDYGAGITLMSQSLSNPHSGYVKPIRRMLRLKCVEWNPDGSFRTVNVGFGDAGAAELLAPR